MINTKQEFAEKHAFVRNSTKHILRHIEHAEVHIQDKQWGYAKEEYEKAHRHAIEEQEEFLSALYELELTAETLSKST